MINLASFFTLPQRIDGMHSSLRGRSMAVLCLCVLTVSPVWANDPRAEIWVCTDPETGAKTYTGKPRNTRHCRSTDISSGTARPTGERAASAPAPVQAQTSSPASARTAARTASDRPAYTPESRARDSDRKQILQDELESENRRLAELQREFNNGAPLRRPEETDNAKFAERKQRLSSELERTRINVRTLERELGRL